MNHLLKKIKNKKDQLMKKKNKGISQTLVLKSKPLSVLSVRQALIDNKIISDDGYAPEDIVDINSAAIWEVFRDIYEKNERLNVRTGHFSFYIEENNFLSQVFEINKKQFQEIISEYCQQLSCSVSFAQEVREDCPGLTLNKVTVKHNFFGREISAFARTIEDELKKALS